MGFQANVIRVMIASPGDVKDERRIVTEEIYRWNDAHAVSRKLMLQPVKWETHSTPRLGAPAQTVLNEQILEDADILIGIFGTRIGTPTEEYVSGTVEEIKRHVAAGRTAKVYFSDVATPPSNIDPLQYQALQVFKEVCRVGGLYATYNDLHSFKDQIQQHLAIELNLPRYLWLTELALPQKDSEQPLSAKGRRILSAAAAFEGVITTLSGADGEYINAGREILSDGTARTAAAWREEIQVLESLGYLEPLGAEAGNYRLTATGFRAAESFSAEEEAKKQLEIDLSIKGAPTTQMLEVKANKPMRFRELEFLTLSGVCVAHDNVHAEGMSASIAISNESLGKLFASPRTEKNPHDHSGPALVRLTYSRGGQTSSLDLPVSLQPVFINKDGASTQCFTLSGQKRFYL